MAIFDSRPKSFNAIIHENGVILDCIYLVFIICPLFIIGLRFWTAPTYLNFTLKLNGMVAIVALPLVFIATDWDIILLSALVFYMNAYAFWYHFDPPSNIYHTSRSKLKDMRVAQKI